MADVEGTHYCHPSEPSAWVRRYAYLVQPNQRVLDVAAGKGRNTRFWLQEGHPVVAIDRNVSHLTSFATTHDTHPSLEVIACDLEAENAQWPLDGVPFACVCIINYLWRPLFPTLLDAVSPHEGVFLYETYAVGNEEFRRNPRNPDHLAKTGELLDVLTSEAARAKGFRVVGFEEGVVTKQCDGARRMVQRVVAVRSDHGVLLPTSE